MSDIPEFRGWEPDLKKYYYFDLYTLYCINPLRVILPIPDEHRPMVLFNINHRPFEEFTGLYDKNGKKIFEGDILRDEYGNTGLCKWEPSNWIFIDHSGYIDDGSPWEIIGNNHEGIK